MKKQLIRLTESDLHDIVRNAVGRAITETTHDSSYNEIKRAHAILNRVMESGFIPFSSPSPSSTEMELKNAIMDADRLLQKALFLCGKLGYNQPPFHIA